MTDRDMKIIREYLFLSLTLRQIANINEISHQLVDRIVTNYRADAIRRNKRYNLIEFVFDRVMPEEIRKALEKADITTVTHIQNNLDRLDDIKGLGPIRANQVVILFNLLKRRKNKSRRFIRS